MAIEFKTKENRTDIFRGNEQIGFIAKFMNTEQLHLKLHDTVMANELEKILSKMKEQSEVTK